MAEVLPYALHQPVDGPHTKYIGFGMQVLDQGYRSDTFPDPLQDNSCVKRLSQHHLAHAGQFRTTPTFGFLGCIIERMRSIALYPDQISSYVFPALSRPLSFSPLAPRRKWATSTKFRAKAISQSLGALTRVCRLYSILLGSAEKTLWPTSSAQALAGVMPANQRALSYPLANMNSYFVRHHDLLLIQRPYFDACNCSIEEVTNSLSLSDKTC